MRSISGSTSLIVSTLFKILSLRNFYRQQVRKMTHCTQQIRLISFCTCVRTSRFFGWVWRHVTYLQRAFWRYKLSPPSVHKIYIFITGNTTNKFKYIYVNLLYYKQGGLLHVSVSYFGHLQGGVFWSVYYIERQNNLIYTNTHTHIYIYIYIVEFSSKSFKSILEYIFIYCHIFINFLIFSYFLYNIFSRNFINYVR